MTKLTTESLEKFVNDIKTDGMCDITDYQVALALRQLLAYEQAAKNPVAFVDERGGAAGGICWAKSGKRELPHGTELYAAPVLPKQPETQFDEIALDTAREIMRDVNQRHELIGGECQLLARTQCRINDVLCNVAAPAQPVIPDNDADDLIQRLSGRAQFLRDRGEVKTPELIEAAISALSAQPVSNPYKLNSWISVDKELPEEGARVLVFSDGAFVLLAEFTGGEFYDVVRDGEEFFETVTRCATHWMPLPTAPAQESE